MIGFANKVTLAAGKWQAEVVPGFGMNMVSLRYEGKPILREPGDMQTLQSSPFLYGTPLLFPANRTANGTFTFEGETYCLPVNEPQFGNHLHGQMVDAPFAVVRLRPDTVMAMYENGGERYPFPFNMTIEDKLTESGMQRTLAITNTGNKAMPFTLAFHTTFVEPACFTAQVGQRFERSATFVPTGNMEEMTEQETAYRTGTCPRGIAISGYYTAAGTTATLDDTVFTASPNFDQRVLFNGGGEQGFLCIEPQCGLVNGLNIPGGHKVLGPGETEVFTIAIGKVGES